MAVEVSPVDLLPFSPDLPADQAYPLIRGVMARTALFAPAILEADFAYGDAAKDLLVVAILRRYRSAGGAVSTETIGPYSVTVDNSALAQGGLYTKDEMDEWARIVRLSSAALSGVTAPTFAFPAAPVAWPDPVRRA